MSKLTPEQAWEHIKALCDDPDFMEYGGNGTYVHAQDGTTFDLVIEPGIIDWGDLTRYPPKEEWRDAVMPQDWGKPCRAKLSDENWGACEYGVLVGHSVKENRFIIEKDGSIPIRCKNDCQVRITHDEPQSDGLWVDVYSDEMPIETAPKDRTILLLMDGMWMYGYFSKYDRIWVSKYKSIAWDRGHQPIKWAEIK